MIKAVSKISTAKMDEWLWGVGNTDRPNDDEMIEAIRAALLERDALKAEVERLTKKNIEQDHAWQNVVAKVEVRAEKAEAALAAREGRKP